MIRPESVDNLLKNPALRFIATVGLLLLTANVVAGVLFNLADLAGDNTIFDRVWRLRYFDIASAVITVGLWLVLATTRRFEQPWWLLVGAAFLAWMLLITPLTTYLPSELAALIGILAFALRGSALILALPTLDRAIPKITANPRTAANPVNVIPPPAVPTMESHVDHLVDLTGQPQQAETQGAGWYPDPRGQATWRWWDGSTWTENVS